MAYFKFRCCGEGVAKIVALVLSVLLVLVGAMHLGYAGNYGLVNSTYQALYNTALPASFSALIISPMAYFVISGVLHILISVLAILLALEVLGKENRLLWSRVMLLLLIFELAFAFCDAVYTSLMAPYYTEFLAQPLAFEESAILGFPQTTRNYLYAVRSYYRFTRANAVINFVVAVPCITALIISMIDEFINEGTVNSPNSVGPTKINEHSKTEVEVINISNLPK